MKYLFIILLTVFTIKMNAQVQFNLNLLSDEETFLVSILPEQTISAPLNRVSNLQVVIKTELGANLDVVQLESMVPGIDWVNSAFLDNPDAEEPYSLNVFSMSQSSSNAVQITENIETPLFTLKKPEGGCLGELTLIDNNDPSVNFARQNKLNCTQSFTVLAARGNAFNGVGNAIADCTDQGTATTVVTNGVDLTAYPVPAYDKLNIEWKSTRNMGASVLEIYNNEGKLVQKIDVEAMRGEQAITVDLMSYTSGLYNFRLKNDKGYSAVKKFVALK